MTIEIAFWSSVALVLYAYLGYPCALMILSHVRRRTVLRGCETPPVSFIIAAHNEADRIAGKIDNTLVQDYPASRFEVIVASDGSTDETEAIVLKYGSRIRLVQTGERRGKEAAQQLAIGMASGEILVFSDVATALAADAVSTIVANFSDPTVGCVSSTDCFVDETGRASGESAYVRYEMWLRSLETRVSTLVGLSGSFFAARREVCRNWATDRPSDFQAVLTAVSMGLRCVIDPRSAGFYQDLADPTREFNRKIRTVVRGLAVLAASPRMLNPFRYGLFAWQLASHKVCRWLVPFAMIAALAANSVLAWSSGFYGATLTGQIGFYLCAVAGSHSRRRYVRLPFYLCQANLAILVAWLRFARGDRIVAWRPSDRAGASRAADIGWPAHLAVRAQKEPQP